MQKIDKNPFKSGFQFGISIITFLRRKFLSIHTSSSDYYCQKKYCHCLKDVEIPQLKASYIVHYDEQFPKEGRCQKFRLSLLDAKTKQKIAEELLDDKSPDAIKQFLISNLDTSDCVKTIF